jgi:hypothetical protein
MISFTQVSVLPTDFRHGSGELSPNKCAAQCDQSADEPRAEDERRRMHLLGDHGGIHKDAAPNNAAHDDHGGVEES